MLTFRSLDNGRSEVDAPSMEELQSSFRGSLIDQKNAEYEDRRRVWNSLIDKKPALIAVCSGQADVVTAVKFARKHNILLSIRGGGHNVGGSALCDDGITIDLTEMRSVRVNQSENTVHVQGGATLADVDRESQVFGLATATGNVSETGIAGLTLGGGFGNLRRKYGLSVDNLISVDIVNADGQVMHASVDENSDLFWAVRGGGGNFGVVTSFEFRLFPLGPEVYFASQFFDIGQASEVCRRWRDFMESASEDISSLGFFWTVPEIDAFPKEIRGQRIFLYGALYAGSAEEGEKELAPLRDIGDPILDLSAKGPYCSWQAGFDAFFTPGAVYENIYAYWKSQYLNSLTNEHIDELVEAAHNMPSNQCLIAIWHLGGAMARVAEDATAFGKRNAPYMLSYDSCWIDPKISESVIAWTRKQVEATERYASGGLYLNFPGVGENTETLVRAAYGSNFDKLADVKRKYDPTNLFRVNQNIRP